jgi:hypothetical protein
MLTIIYKRFITGPAFGEKTVENKRVALPEVKNPANPVQKPVQKVMGIGLFN